MDVAQVVALITGGASGLGEACVRRIVSDGGKASIIDLDATRGEQISEALGMHAHFFRADVTDETMLASAVSGTVEKFGAINAIINCAGIFRAEKVINKNGPMPIDDFFRVVNMNLVGTMNVLRLTVFHMKDNFPNEENERGVIINTASAAALEGQAGLTAYSSSKAGVIGLTRSLVTEFAEYGIRVVTISPGAFKTPMLASIPVMGQQNVTKSMLFPKRPGKPDEFAMMVTQIIENPMLNGETIRLDGALRMSHG